MRLLSQAPSEHVHTHTHTHTYTHTYIHTYTMSYTISKSVYFSFTSLEVSPGHPMAFCSAILTLSFQATTTPYKFRMFDLEGVQGWNILSLYPSGCVFYSFNWPPFMWWCSNEPLQHHWNCFAWISWFLCTTTQFTAFHVRHITNKVS